MLRLRLFVLKIYRLLDVNFNVRVQMDLMERKIDDNNIVYTNLKTFTEYSIF
jgi:hypothetical protein